MSLHPQENPLDVAANPLTLPEALAELARTSDPGVLRALAGNLRTPPATLAELARTSDPGVLRALAGNWATPPATLAELARTSDDPEVLRALADHWRTPPEALAELARTSDDPEVLRVLADRPATPPATLAELARTSDPGVLRALAGNLRTPPATLAELVRTSDPGVLEEIARNPWALRKVLDELARTSDPEVLYEIASNPSTYSWALTELVRDHDSPEVARRVADNPAISFETMLELARTSGDEQVLRNLAHNPTAFPEVVAEVAQNAATPADTREWANGFLSRALLNEATRARDELERRTGVRPLSAPWPNVEYESRVYDPVESALSTERVSEALGTASRFARGEATLEELEVARADAELNARLAGEQALELARTYGLLPGAPGEGELEEVWDRAAALEERVAEAMNAARDAVDGFRSDELTKAEADLKLAEEALHEAGERSVATWEASHLAMRPEDAPAELPVAIATWAADLAVERACRPPEQALDAWLTRGPEPDVDRALENWGRPAAHELQWPAHQLWTAQQLAQLEVWLRETGQTHQLGFALTR